MLTFWILAGLAAALAGLLVLSGARRGVDVDASVGETVEIDALERLRDQGQISAADFAAARAEAARRLLNRERGEIRLVVGPRDRYWILGGLALTAVIAVGLYVLTGSPGRADEPYERRLDEWAQTPGELGPAQLAAVVGRVVRERPDDAQALAMLGAARFEAGDSFGAVSAFRRLVELNPDDAQAWARLGESLVRANDGTIGADAEAAFRRALDIDPDQLGARFFVGEAALLRGDAAVTREMWTPLIAALDPADPRRQDLERRLPEEGAS
ncbi:MAG: c-type cytochrome biogenesis protein CcmI [Brevundimonas sp.]|uniref:c-type cytochrome biogenesis protein CcmI n=1 Tax=Brevundimonas sp. TaxID=1871086 RepID=UPI00391CA7BC